MKGPHDCAVHAAHDPGPAHSKVRLARASDVGHHRHDLANRARREAASPRSHRSIRVALRRTLVLAGSLAEVSDSPTLPTQFQLKRACRKPYRRNVASGRTRTTFPDKAADGRRADAEHRPAASDSLPRAGPPRTRQAWSRSQPVFGEHGRRRAARTPGTDTRD